MANITALSLYIINQVKFKRLVLCIPAKRLAKILDHRPNYVQVIESSTREASYPPHEYPKLADALGCSVHDLLPPDDMDQTSTGELVDKVVLSLSKATDMKLVIEGLIDYGFFDQPKAADDVAKHLFVEKKEQVELLYDVLNTLVKDGLLHQRGELYHREIV